MMLTTETAEAEGATLPALSMPKVSGLWEWMNSSPLDLPEQEGGTAAGKSHSASTDATSAKGGKGHKPGKAKGELDAFGRETESVTPENTGPATAGNAKSFNTKTSRRDAKKSTANRGAGNRGDG